MNSVRNPKSREAADAFAEDVNCACAAILSKTTAAVKAQPLTCIFHQSG
jgi:hypothetical protein